MSLVANAAHTTHIVAHVTVCGTQMVPCEVMPHLMSLGAPQCPCLSFAANLHCSHHHKQKPHALMQSSEKDCVAGFTVHEPRALIPRNTQIDPTAERACEELREHGCNSNKESKSARTTDHNGEESDGHTVTSGVALFSTCCREHSTEGHSQRAPCGSEEMAVGPEVDAGLTLPV